MMRLLTASTIVLFIGAAANAGQVKSRPTTTADPTSVADQIHESNGATSTPLDMKASAIDGTADVNSSDTLQQYADTTFGSTLDSTSGTVIVAIEMPIISDHQYRSGTRGRSTTEAVAPPSAPSTSSGSSGSAPTGTSGSAGAIQPTNDLSVSPSFADLAGAAALGSVALATIAPTATTPEPSTTAMLLCGLGLIWLARRKSAL
jgi:hypothetical protein